MESLYELFRQWLGWQFPDGSKVFLVRNVKSRNMFDNSSPMSVNIPKGQMSYEAYILNEKCSRTIGKSNNHTTLTQTVDDNHEKWKHIEDFWTDRNM